jgi:hypothetical protein
MAVKCVEPVGFGLFLLTAWFVLAQVGSLQAACFGPPGVVRIRGRGSDRWKGWWHNVVPLPFLAFRL